MLSELMFAGTSTRREPRPDRVPGLSGSQLYPCPYRMYKIHTGYLVIEELTPQQVLNLDDGWQQEEQTVRRLKERAGIEIFDRQLRVRIGLSGIPGQIDGKVKVLEKTYLWEHKAWSTTAFAEFVHYGIDNFPQQKAQVNAYAISEGLDSYIFHVKCKENNDYCDVAYTVDYKFAEEVIAWADRIRMEGWVPEPSLCRWCAKCNYGCFGTVVDFGAITEAKSEEMAEKWRQGKKLEDCGKMLIGDARDYFIGVKDEDGKVLRPGVIGDKDVLLIEGLKVLKVPQRRWNISRQSIIKEFGYEGLLKVATEEVKDTYRISDTED